MYRRMLVGLALGAMVWLSGCVSVQAPREVNVGSSRPEPVDSSRVPRTSSHDDCRAELEKAYQNLQYYEREIARWKDKASEYKSERDECEDELDECEERLEELEG